MQSTSVTDDDDMSSDQPAGEKPEALCHASIKFGGPLRLGLGLLLIGLLVFLVYRPMLPGVFLMDDHRLVAEDNPLVDGEFTLGNIWFQTDFILSNIVFWAQWLAWGDHPGNYHAVNLALHALSAMVLWRVLARLKIPGAWVAAAIFAVHPVAVNSVARIAELKNTLSLPFFLLSFWAYLRCEDRSEQVQPSIESFQPPRRHSGAAWYGFSLIAFVFALLAKTSTVMLSPLLLLAILWRRGRIAPRDERRLVPFFLLSVAFGVMSAWFQKYQALADQSLPPQSMGERLAISGKIVWFYLGKDFWPATLNAFYPPWKVHASAPVAYVPLLLLGAVFLLGWRFHRGWGRHVLFGLGGFVLLLFPVLGFFDGQYQTWFQVSDHLQYLPMIAPVAMATAGLAWGLGASMFRLAAAGLILGLALLAHQRATIFSQEETLMRDCLAKNPAAWGAQTALGTVLARRQDYAGAVANFKTALTYQPEDEPANLDLGHALALQGDYAGAEPCFIKALKRKPLDAEAHAQYAETLSHLGRLPEAMTQVQIALALKPNASLRLNYAALLYQTGDFRQTENQLRLAVQAKPNLPDALNNLAWLLATSAADDMRNGTEAVGYAEKACALTGYQQPGMVGTLAAAEAKAGRFPEAVKNCQLAIDLATAAGQPGFASLNQQLLQLYQMGRPYHAAPAGR